MAKQYWGAPSARPAGSAHGPPVQHHEIPWGHVGHRVADAFHDPRRLVSQQEWEVVVDTAVPVVQVGVADPAGEDPHDHVPRAWVGYDDLLDRRGGTL